MQGRNEKLDKSQSAFELTMIENTMVHSKQTINSTGSSLRRGNQKHHS